MAKSTYSIQTKHVNGGGWQDTGHGQMDKANMENYWSGYAKSTATTKHRVMLHREKGDPVQYRTSAPYKLHLVGTT
jgi:hypothetical protein